MYYKISLCDERLKLLVGNFSISYLLLTLLLCWSHRSWSALKFRDLEMICDSLYYVCVKNHMDQKIKRKGDRLKYFCRKSYGKRTSVYDSNNDLKDDRATVYVDDINWLIYEHMKAANNDDVLILRY